MEAERSIEKKMLKLFMLSSFYDRLSFGGSVLTRRRLTLLLPLSVRGMPPFARPCRLHELCFGSVQFSPNSLIILSYILFSPFLLFAF